MTNYIDMHGYCVQEHFVPFMEGPRKGWHQMPDAIDVLEFYDRHEVEKGVILPLGSAESAMQTQSNEEVLNLARLHPDRFVPFCNVDPRNLLNSPDSRFADTLRWYRDRGCRGLGELCCNLPFSDPRVQALLAAAEQVGFPVTIHIAPLAGNRRGLVDRAGLLELEETLKRHPRLLVIGHSQAFWAEIDRYEGQNARFACPEAAPVREGRLAELLRKYPNLCGDLAGESGYGALARDRAYAARFLTEFQDRLLFGLGIRSPEEEREKPRGLPKLLRDMYVQGEIARDTFNKVARENAVRILGI